MQFIWCWDNWRWGFEPRDRVYYDMEENLYFDTDYKWRLYLGPLQIRKWR